jgi:hypothetical protein
MDIGRALAAIAAALNDRKLEHFEAGDVQPIVTEALGGRQILTVDDGGGLHDDSGARVGAIRRTPSGEWITERQNEFAEGAETAIPAKPQDTGLKGLVSRLKSS